MSARAYRPADPELDTVVLEFPERGIELRHWREYSFMSNFLTPAAAWSFVTTPPDERETELRKALSEGELVRLKVNDKVLSTGYIETTEHETSPDGGRELRISGRDRFGQVVDASMEPTFKVKEGATVASVMKGVFGRFGWPNDEDYALAEETDESALSTEISGVKRSKKKGVPLKSFQLQQHEVTPGEGAFEFACRVAHRQGLHIWLSADGETVIVGKPSFDLGPVCRLQVGANVLTSTVRRDLTGQPSIVAVTGFSGGGAAVPREPIRAYALNPGVRVRNKFEDDFKKRYPGAWKVDLFPQNTAMIAPFERPLYIHDDAAQTQTQLANFVKRELSLRARNALTVHCTVEGHGFEADGGGARFVPWTVNTVVDYYDPAAEVDEPLWILGRTFKRSRSGGTSGGTTTDLELIRLNTLSF